SLFSCYGHHLDLHSLPTRRSSDLLIYSYNSANIFSVCSPSFGEPFGDRNNSPSIRIGHRVVLYWKSSPLLTSCTISNTLKPSCPVSLFHSKTSAHQMSAASRMFKQ